MQVDVVGGGPGGAYASLLLAKANPDWDVTVHERYPPATTYGWAIVLPEKVYPILRAADEPTCERILEATVRWDPIDSIHRGERVRCGGHPYTSVMRNELLEILQERCREVGVALNFETEADPVALAETADLVVGADGLGSPTREAYADAFGPTLTERADRYSWFGTDQGFDALTHIYESDEHGVWHAAAYPARTTSTFAVSTDEATWRAAGVADADEDEYLAYLEDVFADHLGGHGLRSKEDRWRHFLTVETERWSHENVVLLGDSAHTAHFTIGSGTRMAMEDAIALADCLEGGPADLAEALAAYEAERKPHVETLQAAADLSVTHFEHLPRYVHLDPEALAFLYLTRTGRNSHEVLRERDPSFVERIDRWFADRCGGDPDAPPARQPYSLRGLEFPTRVVRPLHPTDDATDGLPPTAWRQAAGEAVDGSTGLVVAEGVAVAPEGRVAAGAPGLYADDHVDAWAEAVERIHAAGARAGVSLVHAGRLAGGRSATDPRSAPPADDPWERLAPSPLAYDAGWPLPRAMDADDLDRVRDAFVAASARAEAAGFDVVSVDAADGFLLGSFLSPLANERTDRYGGDRDGRHRYPLSVVEAVRARWPDDRPLFVRLPATDWAPGGLAVEDAFAAAAALDDAGADLFEVTAGGLVPDEAPVTDLAWTRLYSHWVRNEVRVPTGSMAAFADLDDVSTMVAGDRADLCYRRPDATGGS